MTGKELLLYLGDIDPKFYEEAENRTPVSRHRTLRRPLLIAALIALTVMLVGCAVVYALRLQDMSIGTETYTQNFDENGKAIEPVEKTRDIISFYGHSGDAIQQATKEWYAFTESYDPDGALMDNIPDHPEIPNQYEYTYSCYTTEMADKLDEITQKYGLKLLEEWLPIQAWQSDILLEASGMDSLVLPGSGAEVTRLSGMYYPPSNFKLDTDVRVEGIDTNLFVTAMYARKDYFPREFPGGMDLDDYSQWDFTAPDGTALLLALGSKGQGYIFAQQEDAMLIYSIDGNFSSSAYPTEDEIMTKEQLEQIAQVFDYSIRPEILDRDAVAKALEESDAAYDAQNAYVPETYGSFSEYLTRMYLKPNDALQYTFFDINGDGTEELLIGSDGAYSVWCTIQDGQTTEKLCTSTYLCENGVKELYRYGDTYESHSYYAPISNTVIDEIDAEGSFLVNVQRENGQWTKSTDGLHFIEITAEEAQSIIAQYQRVTLNWKPLMDYPLSEDQTLLDYLNAKDVRVSQEELAEIYREFAQKSSIDYSHYRILDINGDGVDDLLLKGKNDSIIGNTVFYWSAYTYRYGSVLRLPVADFYLCENGVLEKTETRYQDGVELGGNVYDNVEVNGHTYLRLDGFDSESLEFVAYNKATAQYQADWYGEEGISETDANAILAKYPRIDQGMQPIEELIG